MKGLLFIDGDPPKALPDLEGYDKIGCTDGALVYLKRLNFPFDKLDFVSGDFDSLSQELLSEVKPKLVFTPDQNFTDFEKALDILKKLGAENVDVLGASGGEQDHYLGNLSAALRFKEHLNLRFYDHYSTYFFLSKQATLEGVKGKMISLVPFPKATRISTTGLKWPLHDEDLEFGIRIGTRNQAIEDLVSIKFDSGELLVFIGKE